MAKKRGKQLGYAFQALATVIVALATLEATSLLQPRSQRSPGGKRRAEGQLQTTNLEITDVLDQVETTVRNNVWPVRKTLVHPDSLWSLACRIVDCNPFVSGTAIALMETYFRGGGMELQINVVSAKMLREAQEKPKDYEDLVVRIAGFSAYFVEVYKEAQDDLIRRTEMSI